MSKGLGQDEKHYNINYFYDNETGQAHLTLFGRAFAFASPDHIEADAKEGVFRAALCRDILHTILKTFPRERIDKFDLERLAKEWQSMATLGPLPSKAGVPPPSPATPANAYQPPRSLVTSSPRPPLPLQPSSSAAPLPSFRPAIANGPTLGNHTLVSPSVAGRPPQQTASPSIAALPASPLPSSPRSNVSAPSTSTAPSSYHTPSSTTSGVQPIFAPRVPDSARTAPAPLTPVRRDFSSPARPPPADTSSSSSKERTSNRNQPELNHKDEVVAYRSLLKADVPPTALQRIKWLCEVHLSRGRLPQVYKPYIDFHIEDKTTRLIVARIPCSDGIELRDDELYLMESTRGKEWLKEELSRQAIANGILTKFTKMKMPKANIRDDFFRIVRDYNNLNTLEPNPKPPPPTSAETQAHDNLSTLMPPRPPLQIASARNSLPQSNAISHRSSAPAASSQTLRSAGSEHSPPATQSERSPTLTTLPHPSLLASIRTSGSEQLQPPSPRHGGQQESIQPDRHSGEQVRAEAALTNASVSAPRNPSVSQGTPTGHSEATQTASDHSMPDAVTSAQPPAKVISASRDPRLQARLAAQLSGAGHASSLAAGDSLVYKPSPSSASAASNPVTLHPERRQASPSATPDPPVSEIIEQISPGRAESTSNNATTVVSDSQAGSLSNEARPLQADVEASPPQTRLKRTPSLSERIASGSERIPALERIEPVTEDHSLLSRLRAEHSAPCPQKHEASTSQAGVPTSNEKVGAASLLDRLVDREAELRRRIGSLRRPSAPATPRNEVETEGGMQVDTPTQQHQAEISTDNRTPTVQEPSRVIAASDLPTTSQELPMLRQSSQRLDVQTQAQAATTPVAQAEVAGSMEQSVSKNVTVEPSSLPGVREATNQNESPAQPLEMARSDQAHPSSARALSHTTQDTGEGAVVSPPSILAPVALPHLPAGPAEPPAQDSALIDAPSDAVSEPAHLSAGQVQVRSAGSGQVGFPSVLVKPTQSANKQAPRPASLPARPPSSAAYSTHSMSSRGDLETEMPAEDVRAKRRRDSSGAHSTSGAVRHADDSLAKRRRRSSPLPPVNGSRLPANTSRARSGADSGSATVRACLRSRVISRLLTCSISQPSTLFDNVQNMTSILAATAEGTMTYDQACEALYALHLPPSMDSAAFEALEAIWANSSARLFQKASADFG